MARTSPDLYQTLSECFVSYIRGEIAMLAARAAEVGHAPLSEHEVDNIADTVVALLAYHSGPKGTPVPRERLIGVVDHVLVVLMTGSRNAA
jgi:hypothetical protein